MLPLDEELYSRLLKERQSKEATIIKSDFSEKLKYEYNECWKVRW